MLTACLSTKQLEMLYHRIDRAIILEEERGCTKEALRQLHQRGSAGVPFESERHARCHAGWRNLLDLEIAVCKENFRRKGYCILFHPNYLKSGKPNR